MFSELRPVGNRIRLKPTQLVSPLFNDFNMAGFQSGTAALAAALLSAKKQRPDIDQPYVLMPAYTCPDVISAARFANVKPLLVDLMPERPWMSLGDLSDKLSSNCIAVIAINFLGIPERIDAIANIVKPHNLVIIEDSAQGFPIHSAQNYWQGDFIVTSFGRGKPLSLLGGGAVFSPSRSNITPPTPLKPVPSSLFSQTVYFLKALAYNLLSRPLCYYFLTRLPGFKLGDTRYHRLDSIKGLPDFIQSRLSKNYAGYRQLSRCDKRYQDFFRSLNHPAIIDLKSVCQLPDDKPLLRYPILVTQPDLCQSLSNALSELGLGASTMYRKTLPNIKGVQKDWLNQTQFPAADDFAHQLITLPLHSDVKDKAFLQITQCIEKHSQKLI